MPKNKKVIAGTGHRPDYMPCGWEDMDSDWANSRKKELGKWLQKNKPEVVISGGAAGWDIWLAEVALELDFKVILYLPFENFGRSWVGQSKKRLDAIRSHFTSR